MDSICTGTRTNGPADAWPFILRIWLNSGKRKEIEKDQSEGILTDTQCKNMTLNDLFEIHMDTRKLAESTQANYRRMWNSLVRNELGQMKVVQVRPSHVRLFYSRLSKQKYSHSTIKFLHNMILPSFEVAVDDDIIRKNPAKRTLGDYGEPEKKRTALSFDQQKNLLNYVKNSEIFHIYLPLLQVMIGTGLRCGELIGLTWKDVDLKTRTVYVNHQLIYKNYGDGCDFHVTMPKTEAGIREIPMSKMVAKAFETQRRLNFQMGMRLFQKYDKVETIANFLQEKDFLPVLFVVGIVPEEIGDFGYIFKLEACNEEIAGFAEMYQEMRKTVVQKFPAILDVLGQLTTSKFW